MDFAFITTKGTIIITDGLTMSTKQFIINFYAYVPVLCFLFFFVLYHIHFFFKSTFNLKRKRNINIPY